jgi:hypothetical protein
MNDNEYAEFVDRAYHDVRMAEFWGAMIGAILVAGLFVFTVLA